MILQSLKKRPITRLNIQLATSLNPLGWIGQGAFYGTRLLLGLLLLNIATAAEGASLQWGRPGVAAVTVSQPVRATETKPLAKITRRATRDSYVMAAVWEEDDSFAVQQTVANEHGVDVEHAAPVYDPFEEEDRLAQLPDDPFDEPIGESIPEQESDIEEIEDAVEDEIRRRQSADELFDEEEIEPLDSDPLEGAEEGLFDDDFMEEEEEEVLQPGEDEGLTPDFGLEFGETDEQEEVDEQPTADELEQHARELEEEQRISEENCREELEEVESDRISSIDLSIRVDGAPGKDFPYECAVSTKQHQQRQWSQITYNWKAAALCHKPLYFEQVQLERYGHSWGPYVQPIMSGAHFFGTLPVLPYKMGIRTPCECVYSLGYYRPGSCAPYMIDPIPFTWRAAFFEGAAATGISFVIP